MDALLGTKLTYEKVQAKIEAVRVAKGETANPKEYMALEKKATTYTKAQEFAKAIDIWIELVATASKSNQADDMFVLAVVKYNLASALHRVRACRSQKSLTLDHHFPPAHARLRVPCS